MQRSESLNNSSNSLKLRRPSTRVPTSDPDIDSPSARSRSGRFQKSISGLSDSETYPEESGLTPKGSEEGDEEEKEGEGGEKEGGGSGHMSLMALLAETDREMGLETAYVMEEEEEEEEEVEDENDGGNDESGEYNNCCVCMVRHKGAAFIPCGHTFCRLCSRELYVQRGNCPLCNGFILEILDIF